LVYGPNNWNTTVSGVNRDYLRIRNWPLAEGSNFSASEIRSAARVAIIGRTVATRLFGSADPVGRVIRVSRSPFLVIGLLSSKGQSFRGQDQDDVVLIPVTTALRKLFGSQFANSVRFVMVQGSSPEVLGQVQREIEALLRQRHHIPAGKEADFSVRNLTEIVNAAMSTTRIMSLLLGAIASISLIVGGIGIMNIMLVSVSERTREIGLRMAIGARPRDILQQFLAEALLVSLGGCLIGLLIGAGAIEVVKYLFQLNSQVTLASVLIAFAVSLAVGVFFGLYPARKAARLEPIDALRYQ
jgi:putative ABC transport system permease protein